MARKKEYELVSHSKIESLRDELDQLRSVKGKKPSHVDVLSSMHHMTNTLERFMSMFEEAVDEMKAEEKEEEIFLKEIKPLMDKLDQVLEQNEKIAQGVVALADMINDVKMPAYEKLETKQELVPETKTMFSPEQHEYQSVTTFNMPQTPLPPPTEKSMPSPPPLRSSMPPPPPLRRQ
jgi:hypothetical protein